MHYPIPSTTEELLDLQQAPATTEAVAAGILGLVQLTRAQGRTLPDLLREVLAEDALLDADQRRWLGQLVSDTWQQANQN